MKIIKPLISRILSTDSRAQAALMDSLFFLAIVSTICTLLFFFAMNYGTVLEKNINSFYSSDFAVDSLKVVTYVNVLRDGNDVYSIIPNENPQYDYLFTLIKEDYADTKELKPTTKRAIKNTLSAVMRPFEESLDYSFFIMNEDTNNFLFLMFAVHDYNTGIFDEDDETKSNLDLKYYSCNPQKKDLLAKEILPNVGKVDSSISKITLFELGESGSGKIFVIGLHLWISKDYSALNLLTHGTDADGTNFNCVEIE